MSQSGYFKEQVPLGSANPFRWPALEKLAGESAAQEVKIGHISRFNGSRVRGSTPRFPPVHGWYGSSCRHARRSSQCPTHSKPSIRDRPTESRRCRRTYRSSVSIVISFPADRQNPRMSCPTVPAFPAASIQWSLYKSVKRKRPALPVRACVRYNANKRDVCSERGKRI